MFASPPLQFLNAARGGVFSLAVSDALLDEIHRVLRDKFKCSKEALDAAAANLADFTRRVHATRTIDAVLAGNESMAMIFYGEKMLDPLRPVLMLPEVLDGSKWKKGKLLPSHCC